MPPPMALPAGARDAPSSAATADGEAEADDPSCLRHTPSTVRRLAGEYERRDQFASDEREFIESTWLKLKEGPRTEAAQAVEADIKAAVAAANEGPGGGGDPADEKEPSFAIKAAIVAVASGKQLPAQ
ncbi:hypothetical protein BU14_0325s0005 [Porphyra umbilicalis]|uniref:Uncharacterized protein n=1 Tax=Porphyra umbilicalis TaxID=2786 RepID=A0A1X6NZ57_PORUM|nr:hypothetical protein BU14_0325s0005 [Porphyra umbilicalis]|eukprot:OSX73825.1 hypothetical protein BU14_0325s0005 [Porphyra umbilicalis]